MAATDNGFLEQAQLELEKVVKTASVKSNILLFGKNFNTLVTWLRNLRDYVAYLKDLINVENLVNVVIESFQNSKLSIVIDYTMYEETSVNVVIGNTTYKVERVDSRTIEITNITNPEWVVDKLLIGIKNLEGVTVYPKITTINNKITIYFADGILSNYVVIIL